MNLAQLIPLVLKISIGTIVFCIALQSDRGDLTYLLRRPSLLARSLLSMNVVMPIFAAIAAAMFNLRPDVKLALILFAVAPVPPILPNKEGKAGGNVSYAVGLLMVSALVAIVTVPLTIALIGRLFGRDVQVPIPLIAMTVATSVIVPLILGAIVRNLAPSFAKRAAKPLAMASTILLVVALIPILLRIGPAIVGAVGDFTLVAIVAFVLVSLAVGHLLGGPDPEDRTVLAVSTASRHPAVALAIAGAVAAPENKPAVSATVLLAVLVSAIVVVPYVKWRKRSHTMAERPAVHDPA